jgi:hypothetical protein
MAEFSAITEVDIVGSKNFLLFPPALAAVPGSTDAFVYGTGLLSEYYIFNTSPPGFLPTSTITSFSHLKSSVPFVIGAGEVEHIWKADSGDSYLLGTTIVADKNTLFGLIAAVNPTDPTKAAGTEQELNQFFFKFDDSIHGSDEDDKLCGWAGDDMMWGNLGDDEFYYGKGMGIDKIMDCDKNDDTVIFDTDLYENFRQLKKDAKYGNDKVTIKVDSDEKLYIYGIETRKELKAVADFDDFTDFQ